MKKSLKEKKIGFIGLGLMGRAFSRNLIADGYTVVGTDPDPVAGRKFKKLGGIFVSSPKILAEKVDIVFISVPNSKISLRAARGKNGYLAFSSGCSPEIVIDTTTADPEDSRKHAKLCKKKNLPYLDGCVSGNSGYVTKRDGLFLVGGDKRPIKNLNNFSMKCFRTRYIVGPPGQGQK